MNYTEANRVLGERDSLNTARIIGGRTGNTFLERRPDEDGAGRIALRLYETDVLVFAPRWTELHTGGWPTKTTTEAINQFGPVQVYSHARVLRVRLAGEDWGAGGHPFFEGMRVSPDGKRLMRAQPYQPEGFEPLELVSGFTGAPLARGAR